MKTTKKQISTAINEQLIKDLKLYCVKHDVTISKVIEDSLALYLSSKNKEN